MVVLLSALFIIITIILFVYTYLCNKNLFNQNYFSFNVIDNFITPQNANTLQDFIPVNTYKYLQDSNYTKKIINKYYLNDDTKINGSRIVNHPYQVKNGRYFGNARFLGNTKTQSDNIYNWFGIRV